MLFQQIYPFSRAKDNYKNENLKWTYKNAKSGCILSGSVRGRVSSSRTRFWTLPNLNLEVSTPKILLFSYWFFMQIGWTAFTAWISLGIRLCRHFQIKVWKCPNTQTLPNKGSELSRTLSSSWKLVLELSSSDHTNLATLRTLYNYGKTRMEFSLNDFYWFHWIKWSW